MAFQRFLALGWEQRSAMDDIGVLRAKVPHAKLFSANFFALGPAASPTSWQRRVGVRFAVS